MGPVHAGPWWMFLLEDFVVGCCQKQTCLRWKPRLSSAEENASFVQINKGLRCAQKDGALGRIRSRVHTRRLFLQQSIWSIWIWLQREFECLQSWSAVSRTFVLVQEHWEASSACVVLTCQGGPTSWVKISRETGQAKIELCHDYRVVSLCLLVSSFGLRKKFIPFCFSSNGHITWGKCNALG